MPKRRSGRSKRRRRQGGRLTYRMEERRRATCGELREGEKFEKLMKQNADYKRKLKDLLDRMRRVPLEKIRINEATGEKRFPEIDMGLTWLISVKAMYSTEEAASEELSEDFLREAFKEYDITYSFTGTSTMSFVHRKFSQASNTFATAIDAALDSGATGKALEKAIVKILTDRLKPQNYQQKKPLGDSGTLTTSKSKKIEKEIVSWGLGDLACEPTDARALAAQGRGVVLGMSGSPASTGTSTSSLLQQVKDSTASHGGGKSGGNPWQGAFGNDPGWTKLVKTGKISAEAFMKMLTKFPGMSVTLTNGRVYDQCYLGAIKGPCAKYFVEDGMSLSNFWTNNNVDRLDIGISRGKVVAFVRDFDPDGPAKVYHNYVFVVKETRLTRVHEWPKMGVPCHGCHVKTEYKKAIGDALGFVREKKGIKMTPCEDTDAVPVMGYGYTAEGSSWNAKVPPHVRITFQGCTKTVSVVP